MPQFPISRSSLRWGAALAGLAVAVPAATASAAPTPHRWSVEVLAASPSVDIAGRVVHLTQPDDLDVMGDDLFVVFQNGTGPQGQAAPDGTLDSTVVELGPAGAVLLRWQVMGHADGLTADPAHHRVIVTVNEDANTSVYTIDPTARRGQVVHYHYSPGNPLPHGGGTDSIAVDGGQLLVSASAPGTVKGSGTTPGTRPAVYRMTLHPGRHGGGVADLTAVFSDGSRATVANTARPTLTAQSPTPSWTAVPPEGTTVTMGLTDPDSSEVVPATSPRFAHDFVLDSQGDMQLVFASHPGTARQHLSTLYLSQSIDNTAYVTSRSGALYVDDATHDEVLRITGPFRPGEALVAASPGDANHPGSASNYLGQLNLNTGTVAAIPALSFVVPKGAIWAPSRR